MPIARREKNTNHVAAAVRKFPAGRVASASGSGDAGVRPTTRDAIVTIGNFDGVHRGHQFILRQVADPERSLGCRSFVMTFDPQPRTVWCPHEPAVAKLADDDEKVALIRDQAIDEAWVCGFTRKCARLSADQFIDPIITRQPVRELWIGS